MNEEGQAFGKQKKKKKTNAHSCEHPSLFFKKSKRALWFFFLFFLTRLLFKILCFFLCDTHLTRYVLLGKKLEI
jgi:hypothetical protein